MILDGSLARKCTISRAAGVRGSPLAVCGGFILGLIALLGVSGCAPALRSGSTRPVRCVAPQVFVNGGQTADQRVTIGILPATAPAYAGAAASVVTSIYYQELLRGGGFKQVIEIPHQAAGKGEALWWGRADHCDLVMSPRILSLWYGSGALPTRLEMEVRIFDVRTGGLLWFLRQKAFSEPGSIVDLGWATLPGQPARTYPALARRLAGQLSRMVAPPAKTER